MGPLIKGMFIGVVGAVVLLPAALLFAIIGLPLFLVGGALVAAALAVPLILVAALSLPFILLAGLAMVAVFVAAVIAIKIALFVVLPVALIALVIGWAVRTYHERHATQFA